MRKTQFMAMLAIMRRKSRACTERRMERPWMTPRTTALVRQAIARTAQVLMRMLVTAKRALCTAHVALVLELLH